MQILFGIIILAFSVILHEVAHGYMANYLGDPTARLQGRLTLNPIKHVDPIGTILLPAILLITHSPVLIGYAKPVPYNPYNLPGKYDEVLVAGAGPATNVALAVIFGLLIRFVPVGSPALLSALGSIVFVNILLAIFNLIPLPPLDGSKVLSGILPGPLSRSYDRFRYALERLGVLSGTLIILILFYLFSPLFYFAIEWLFVHLTGTYI